MELSGCIVVEMVADPNEILSRPAWLRCTAPWCKAELLLHRAAVFVDRFAGQVWVIICLCRTAD